MPASSPSWRRTGNDDSSRSAGPQIAGHGRPRVVTHSEVPNTPRERSRICCPISVTCPTRTPRSRRVVLLPGASTFIDDAEAAGLRFAHENGSNGDARRLIPPVSMCGGVGLLDYDGDGWLDVYCVQGGQFPAPARAGREGDRLFRNRGDGTFDDVDGPLGSDACWSGDTVTASRSATTTTTAIPTCSSPAGDPMPSTAIEATARSRT